MVKWLFIRVPRQFSGEKNNLFNKWCQNNWISICKRIKLGPYITPYVSINSKWIKDLNIKAKTIKLLEENIGINFYDLGLSNCLLNMIVKG